MPGKTPGHFVLTLRQLLLATSKKAGQQGAKSQEAHQRKR